MTHASLNVVPGTRPSTGRRALRSVLLWGLWVGMWLFLSACSMNKQVNSVATAQTRTFVSQNFFSMDYPSDWVTRDLDDGANLFYAEELILVRVKVYEPPDPTRIQAYMEGRIRADSDLQGGQANQIKSGSKGNDPFLYYVITKPNGQRIQEVLIYNTELQLLYVLSGSSRPEDSDEFAKIFNNLFDSFQFRISARLPVASGVFQSDVSTIQGTWASYLEGLRTREYDLLQKSCARVNGSKLMNDAVIREVRADYFPYESPVYTFVSRIETRDRVARVTIGVRALPPEGFLRHETREFILEDDHWRLLRLERTD